jgi:hypothetical protein
MTWAASAWALTVPMPTSSKFVLLVLANFTDENESCFPGVSRLAETTGYSERNQVVPSSPRGRRADFP